MSFLEHNIVIPRFTRRLSYVRRGWREGGRSEGRVIRPPKPLDSWLSLCFYILHCFLQIQYFFICNRYCRSALPSESLLPAALG
jgi:hypothetical protein